MPAQTNFHLAKRTSDGLIYAFAETSSDSIDKIDLPRHLLASLSRRNELILSAQVLSEFASNAMRKGLSPTGIPERVFELSEAFVIPIDASLVQLALTRVQQSRLSYRDALIVEAALRSGATILSTEDMSSGTLYGSLELRNPFLP